MVISRFIAFNISTEVVSKLRPLVTRIRRMDKDLANQIVRAGSSISVNLLEGCKRVGADRLHCFRIAAGSADEVRAALTVVIAWGHAPARATGAALELRDRQAALLYRLFQPRT